MRTCYIFFLGGGGGGIPVTVAVQGRNIHWQTLCLTSSATMKLIRDGEGGVWRWWEREIIHLSLTLSPPE